MSTATPLALLIGSLALAAHAEAPPAPRIVVAISVDQFSSDVYAEYQPLFRAGLRRLGTGVVFPAGYQSHGATETCPGHSTILTGSHPSRTGIVGNEWIDQSLPRPDKVVYCVEDPAVAGSSSRNYTVSPQFLKAQTLGDRVKAAWPGSRVVSVAGKDRAAIMLGGHSIDQAWFWAKTRFTTLAGVTTPAPAVVGKVNAEVATELARPTPPKLSEACRSHSAAVSVGNRTVGILAEHKPNDSLGFQTSLAFDRATADIAIGLIHELRLGEGPAPDVLSIGLSATDYVGHVFGTGGAEMCMQVLGVDEGVGRILDALDATHQPYIVVLTADHGGLDLAERSRIHGMPDAVRVDPALLPANMGKALATEFNLKEPVLVGNNAFGDVYLASDLPAAIRVRVLEAARARYLAHPQVAAVFTAAELRRTPAPSSPVDEWSLAERYRASFDPDRSGDLIVALKPHVTGLPSAEPYVAMHGSPWNYDRRVPILFYRPGMAGFEQPLAVETVDILPTLAAQIALPIPAVEIDGRCLDLSGGSGDRCVADGNR